MNYYTYLHSTPDGTPFYVGKGTSDRAYSRQHRPWAWKKTLNESNGWIVNILAYFETEKEAYEHERFLVQVFRETGYALTNQTEGGRGSLGYKQSPECRSKKREKMLGYVHKKVTCPHCGFVGGETSTKRWHFDKCAGLRPKHKARITVNGIRHYLGKFQTKEEAQKVEIEFKQKSMGFCPVTIPDGNSWTITG